MRAINLGSVSNPVTSDRRATYVLISSDRDGHRVEHRRVGYDHEAVIARVFATGHPAAEFIAGFQGVNKP